jgi:hypothetical protein
LRVHHILRQPHVNISSRDADEIKDLKKSSCHIIILGQGHLIYTLNIQHAALHGQGTVAGLA